MLVLYLLNIVTTVCVTLGNVVVSIILCELALFGLLNLYARWVVDSVIEVDVVVVFVCVGTVVIVVVVIVTVVGIGVVVCIVVGVVVEVIAVRSS